MSGRFGTAHPELQVYYVPTLAMEQNESNVGREDCGNILVDSGKRVRIVEGGTVGGLEPLTEYEAQQEFEWAGGLFIGDHRTECPAKYRAVNGLPEVTPEPETTTNRPRWNCVDFADGMHYTPGSECQWCGKTREEINRQPVTDEKAGTPEAGTSQAPVTEVGANVVVIRPDALGDFLAGINASVPIAEIDRTRTVTHRNGITQVFSTAQRDRAAGESAIGAYQRYGDSYRTYAPDGSSLGTWATETGAYNAIGGQAEAEPEAELEI
ncbi:MAG: hypothetical protein ACRDRJ_05100 [Streptosporangiaceae bacterium]